MGLRADGVWASYPGRWSSGWTLGGMAIQDVLDCPTALNHYPGSTIRCYEPATGTCRAVSLAPCSSLHVTLRARPSDSGIILEGATHLGLAVRWIFSDITDNSFVWRSYVATDAGSFELAQEMRARRV